MLVRHNCDSETADVTEPQVEIRSFSVKLKLRSFVCRSESISELVASLWLFMGWDVCDLSNQILVFSHHAGPAADAAAGRLCV